jgi:hypothetical protein
MTGIFKLEQEEAEIAEKKTNSPLSALSALSC